MELLLLLFIMDAVWHSIGPLDAVVRGSTANCHRAGGKRTHGVNSE